MAQDTWSSGAAYDGYIGRWSRPVAERFVPWLEPQPAATWIDVGCGSGALTETILGAARPVRVVGVDPSADFVEHARSTIQDERSEFVVGDGAALPAASESADHVVSGLVLNFIADPDAALAEMSRVATAGATIAAYVWDYADGMQMLRAFWDAAIALDPGTASLDESTRFPLCRPEPLQPTVRGCGTLRRRDERHHGGHHVHRLRRLLDAIPEWPGPSAGLLLVPRSRRPGPVARPPSRSARTGRRPDRPHGTGLGGQGDPSLTAPCHSR